MAETLAAPTEAAKPEAQQESKADKPIKRQMIGFTFFKVMPEWRRLPHVERTEHKRLFAGLSLRRHRPPAT